METSTATDAATVNSVWELARRTTLGIVLVGLLGALAGFACARFLWM